MKYLFGEVRKFLLVLIDNVKMHNLKY